MNFLKNPRIAPTGNRTIWITSWMFEWGIVLALLSIGLGFYSFLAKDKGGAEIAIVIAAPMGILAAFGGWGMQVYLSKSKSREYPEPPEPPEPGK